MRRSLCEKGPGRSSVSDSGAGSYAGMKYCKKCGVIYTTDVCPNCGILIPDEKTEQKQADPKEVRRNWIALIVGIPLFIGVIMLIVYLFQNLTH